jgi:hypothetical protein
VSNDTLETSIGLLDIIFIVFNYHRLNVPKISFENELAEEINRLEYEFSWFGPFLKYGYI